MTKPWRQRGDTLGLEQLATDLLGVYYYYTNENQDPSQLNRIQRLGDSLTEELLSLQDVIRVGDRASEQAIQRTALVLDNFRAQPASHLVKQKYKAIRVKLTQEQISRFNAELNAIVAQRLLDGFTKALGFLLAAKGHIVEAPELAALFWDSCSKLAAKTLDCLPEMLDVRARDISELEQRVANFDNLCTQVVKDTGTPWDPLLPRLKEVTLEICSELLTSKLLGLEGALSSDRMVNYNELLQSLDDILNVWISPTVEQNSQLVSLLDFFSHRIQCSFDEAISAGDAGSMEHLVCTAKEFDKFRKSFQGASAPEDIASKLETTKAGITLNALLNNAKTRVGIQSKDLYDQWQDTESKVRKLPRESLDELAEGFRWKFKLASGAFKDYDDEKSNQVERLYQDWVSKGRPTDEKDRRYEIAIQVRSTSTPCRSVAASVNPPRERCKYGDTCYRKNAEHRTAFAHPNDWDWEPDVNPPASSTMTESSEAGEIRAEKFSLDFLLMTQVNLSSTRKGMRNINRVEGKTIAQKLTCEYFEKVIVFVKEAEATFSKAANEMHLLGQGDRIVMEKQVNDLIASMSKTLREFLHVAVMVRDTKVVDQVMALLGEHSRHLGLTDALKELRLGDVLEELKQAYAQQPLKKTSLSRWAFLRQTLRHQKVGPRNLLHCRLSLVKTKQELATLTRRRVQMRCQALLSEYDSDKEFCDKFREKAVEVLSTAIQIASEKQDLEVVQGILRTAIAWQCDIDLLLAAAGHMITQLLRSAIQSRSDMSRLIEVLNAGNDIAKGSQRLPETFYDLRLLIQSIATKVFTEVQSEVKVGGSGANMPALAKKVLDLRSKLAVESAAGFDLQLWQLLQPWYASLPGGSEQQTCLIEWAMVYCEQLRMPLPQWMMNKDQVEALRQLQAAIESGDEKQLREAVVFAKQTDYKTDPKLSLMYDTSLAKLRSLKRLPSGWEVTDLVGDDVTSKMFKKADLESPELKMLFQNIFDETKASIITRDRAGSMPRGYRVEKIVSVMNAESWGSYLKRMDEIQEQCRRVTGAAPCSSEVWEDWSGKIQTHALGEAILNTARLPPLTEHANEFLMFHGTKPEAADSIAKNHFDMAFACKTGLFGAGLYFAESSSKSDEYVKADAKDWYPMILCRVALGRINYCAAKDPVSDPGRDKLEHSCLGGGFHSVLGDRKKIRGTYREFVVYDHYQVYPHFIVWYTRIE